MKVTVDSKKGLKTNLKVFVDKKTIDEKITIRLNELSKTVNIKGFRPGKVPVDVLKRQFGKAVYGEVLEKVLKETSTKALEEKKIKIAGQPKLDLKTYGEGKENDRKSKMNKQTRRISEFFAALWITLKDDMKKEAQTYREEREQQKRIKNSGK